MADKLMMIDVDNAEINPDDLQLAHDADGLPRAEPSEKVKAAGAENPAARKEPPRAEAELISLRERFAQAERDRDARAAEAATERAAREKAEKDAATNIDYAVKTHGRAIGSEYREALAAQREIASGIESVQQFQSMAEDSLRRTLEDDNLSPQERAVRITKANKEIAAAAARLETLESGRRGVENSVAEAKQAYEDTVARTQAARDAKPEPKAEPEAKPTEKAQPKPPATADEFIATAPAATQDWLREHREFADPNSDENVDLNAFAMKWLRKHKGDPNSLNSNAFVEALDAEFAPNQEESEPVAEAEPEIVETPKKPQPRKTTPAAPVSRSATPGRTQGTTEIGLNLKEQETAAQMYPDLDRAAALKRYARNKAMALRDGLYERRA